jgi:hypothetical protein
MESLTELFVDAINTRLADGWHLPIFFSAIAANGSVLSGRYEENAEGRVETKIVAEHFENDVFILPINMMLTNVEGEAVRLSIQNPGEPVVYH